MKDILNELTLSVRRSGADIPSIVVGHIGGEASNLRRTAGILINGSEKLGGRGEVSAPAQPSCVPSIQVHRHIRQVKLLECIVGAFKVCGLRIRALGNVQVSHQIRQAVWLDHQDDPNIRERGQLLLDGVDVGFVICNTIVGDAVLAIGRRRRAISVGQIIHDKEAGVGRARGLVGGANVGESAGHQSRHLVGCVARAVSAQKQILTGGQNSQPLEGRHLGDGGGLCSHSASEGRDGTSRDLRRIIAIGPHLDTGKGVPRPSRGATADRGG